MDTPLQWAVGPSHQSKMLEIWIPVSAPLPNYFDTLSKPYPLPRPPFSRVKIKGGLHSPLRPLEMPHSPRCMKASDDRWLQKKEGVMGRSEDFTCFVSVVPQVDIQTTMETEPSSAA